MEKENSVVLVGKHADTEEDDGELSGAQIDGNLAAQKMLEKETSVIVQFLTQVWTQPQIIVFILGAIISLAHIPSCIQTSA